MAIKLGEIFVSLGLSTASFSKNLNDAKKLTFDSTREMERSFKVLGQAMTGAFVSAGAGLILFTRQAIDNADRMGKLAQTTGMGVEQFSALAYAAKHSEIETETLSRGMVILAKNLEKANQQTLEGKAAHSALSTLFHSNIPLFKDTNDAFQQIAAKLSQLPVGFQKTALAAQIFGKTGASLIPMLGTLREMTDRARELGIVISAETAAKAEKFNETLKDVYVTGQAFGQQLAAALLPNLQRLADQFLEGAKGMQAAKLSVQVLATALAGVVGAFRVAGNAAGLVSTILWAAGDPTLSLSERIAMVKSSLLQLGQTGVSTADTMRNIWTPATRTAKQAMDELWSAAHAFLAKNPWGGLGEQVHDAQDKVAKFVQALKDQVLENGLSVTALNLYKAAQIGATAADLERVRALSKQLELQKIWDSWKPAAAAPGRPTKPGDPMITVTKLPMDSSMPELETIAQTLAKAGVTADFFWKQMAEGARKAKPGLTEIQQGLIGLKARMKEYATEVEQAFANTIVDGGNFRQMLAGIMKDLEKMILYFLVIKPLFNWLAVFVGALIPGIFGSAAGPENPANRNTYFGHIPGRAGGGSVYGPGPFMVGEKGSELFWPPASGGTIVPNDKLGGFGGGGVTIVQNFDNRGADLGTVAKMQMIGNKIAIEQYHRMVLDRQSRTA